MKNNVHYQKLWQNAAPFVGSLSTPLQNFAFVNIMIMSKDYYHINNLRPHGFNKFHKFSKRKWDKIKVVWNVIG